LTRMGGRRELYEKTLKSFMEEYKNFPQRLSIMLEEESEDAYILTHSLKNIAASMGAEELRHRAELLEISLKAEEFNILESHISSLVASFNQLMEYLHHWVWLVEPKVKTNQENLSVDRLIEHTREALDSFTPRRVKICRNQWEQSCNIPDNKQQLAEKLIKALKKYDYQEARDLLEQL
ncbi:MAG: hypothetical protein PF447_06580, partial [Spirochaetaceae bacterium]|nr:hypothetical protein [Spirochaetaceae bacterium]